MVQAGITRRQFMVNDLVGNYRNTAIVWSPTAAMPADISIDAPGKPKGKNFLCVRDRTGKMRSNYDDAYHARITIPKLSPGNYKLNLGAGLDAIPIQVLNPIQERKFAADVFYTRPGMTFAIIQAAINSGCDIVFNPGFYDFGSQSFTTHPQGYHRFIGYGAVIKRPAGDFLFKHADGDSFEGFTFIGEPRADANKIFKYQAADDAVNAAFVRCTFMDCCLGYPGSYATLHACTFDNAAPFGFYSGLREACVIKNTRDVGAGIFGWGSNYSLACVDDQYTLSDRGPCFNGNWGDVRGALFCGLTFEGVKSDNGSEAFLFESTIDRTSTGLHDALIFHTTQRHSGALLQLDGHASNIYVRDLEAYDSNGPCLWGGDIDGVTFEEFEYRDCGPVVLRSGAKNITFRKGAFVNNRGGRFNEIWFDESWYPQPNYAVREQEAVSSPSTRFERVCFNMRPGDVPFMPNARYACNGVRFNDQPFGVYGGK
jgi:hypothetical protein